MNSQYKQVIEDVRQVHQLNEDFLPSYVVLVDAHEKLGQFDQARQTLKDLTRLDPENRKVRLYYAKLLVRSQDFKAARVEFGEMIELYPEDLDLLLTAGVLAIQDQDPVAARGYFNTLLTKHHRTNEALYQLGLLELQEGNIEAALESLLRITPSSVFQEARFRAGQLQSQQGDIESAIQTFEQAAELQPQAQDLYFMGVIEVLSFHQDFQRGHSSTKMQDF